jgi:hypothetical protein
VNSKGKKCPNCGLYYDVNKVRDQMAKAAEALESEPHEKTVPKVKEKAPKK